MKALCEYPRLSVACAAILACTAFCLAIVATPSHAWAEGGTFGEQSTQTDHDTAGNVTIAGNTVNVNQDVERDAILAGYEVSVEGVSVGGDVLVGARDVKLSHAQVGGDVRAGANTVTIEKTQVEGNITAAGNDIEFGRESHAASVYAFGSYVTFDGEANYASISGRSVEFNGKVDGDVLITADSVKVGEGAEITGKLTVVGAQPEFAEGAQFGAIDVRLADDRSSARRMYDSLVSAIVLLLTMIVTIAAIYWIAPEAPQDSLFMLQARTVPMIATGAIALLAAPLVVIALLVSGIGSLLAVVLMCLIGALALLGIPFMSVAIARRVMRGSREWAVVGMAAAIAGLILSIPVVDVIGVICGGAYIAGYVLQRAFLKLQARQIIRSRA